jgi:AcrR family transcriptional regulator
MARDTKERILETALELFAQNGYLGTSMNDIAGRLGFTKATLYKHYTSKQEILDRIVERMNRMDYARAEEYEMPETEPDGFAEAYMHTPVQKIRAYSMAQFDHWTKDPFSSNFRKMLTLEQYRDPKLAQLYHDYLVGGPLEYMAAIFRKLTDSDDAAMQLALEFYGPMYLLYSVYDSAENKKSVSALLAAHIDRFIEKAESGYRKNTITNGN